MAWQAADPGTVAQDDKGTYHVKVGDSWVAAPSGTIAKDDTGAFHYDSDAFKPAAAPDSGAAPAASAPAPQEPGLGTVLKHGAMDMAGVVARGAGDVLQSGRRLGQAINNEPIEPYDSPNSYGSTFAAPFQHAPDWVTHPYYDLKETPQTHAYADAAKANVGAGVNAVLDNPVGQTVRQDVVPPVAHIAGAVGTVAGGLKGVGAGMDALDTGINAANSVTATNRLLQPSAAKMETLKATPQVTRLRADDFKISGRDMNAASGPPAPGEPKALHGAANTDENTLREIQQYNQARATSGMAQDVNLRNTRAIDPDEVQQRMNEEGAVYQQVGHAIGEGRTPTPQLDHELLVSAPSAATPEATKANTALVQYYRDHFGSQGFSGRDAVQSVRDLRNEGDTAMASNDVNAQSLGRTKIGIANAIENEMMRQIPVQAQDLKTAFPEARMQLAKLHELQSVTEGGQVNANKVLQLQRSGAPLTGQAAAVANASDVAPTSMGRAAGTPDILPYAPTHTGLFRDAWNGARRLANKLPGRDQSTDAYQEAHYGPTGTLDATPPASSAPKVSPIPPPLELTPGGRGDHGLPGAHPSLQDIRDGKAEFPPPPFEGGRVGDHGSIAQYNINPIEQGPPTLANTPDKRVPPPFEMTPGGRSGLGAHPPLQDIRDGKADFPPGPIDPEEFATARAYEAHQYDLRHAHDNRGPDLLGDPMDQATWDREALKNLQRYKGETDANHVTGGGNVTGANITGNQPGTMRAPPRWPSDIQGSENFAEELRKRRKLGETMR